MSRGPYSTLHHLKGATSSHRHCTLPLPDPQPGGDPAGLQAGVRPTLGSAQQADPGAAGGAQGGEVAGGAPGGDQPQSAVREAEARGGNRQLPAAHSGHDG